MPELHLTPPARFDEPVGFIYFVASGPRGPARIAYTTGWALSFIPPQDVIKAVVRADFAAPEFWLP